MATFTSALFYANNFLEKSFNEKIPITHMKLQKLIYILYQRHLKSTGESLFCESFEAWKYGPVLRSVASLFSKYGTAEITEYFITYRSTCPYEYGKKYYKTIVETTTEVFFYNINNVWNICKYREGYELSRLTQYEGGAWDKAVKSERYILLDEDIKKEKDYLVYILNYL